MSFLYQFTHALHQGSDFTVVRSSKRVVLKGLHSELAIEGLPGCQLGGHFSSNGGPMRAVPKGDVEMHPKGKYTDTFANGIWE